MAPSKSRPSRSHGQQSDSTRRHASSEGASSSLIAESVRLLLVIVKCPSLTPIFCSARLPNVRTRSSSMGINRNRRTRNDLSTRRPLARSLSAPQLIDAASISTNYAQLTSKLSARVVPGKCRASGYVEQSPPRPGPTSGTATRKLDARRAASRALQQRRVCWSTVRLRRKLRGGSDASDQPSQRAIWPRRCERRVRE
jgi:hypothetical protein